MGISDELNKNNGRLHFHFITLEEERNEVLPAEITSEVDGIIILSVFAEQYMQKIASCRKPMVFLDAPQDTGRMAEYGDIILFEGMNSVMRMTEQMILEGAKKVAFIGDITYCRSMYERFRGFMYAVRHAGVEEDKELYKVSRMPNHYYNKKEVYEAMSSFPYLPDAIVCANDDIANDVLTYLKEKEIEVPGQVMITGFDNKEETAFLTPSLTTAYISNQRMGKRLVQQIMWRIENPEMPHEIITVNTQVIYRESSTRHR